MGKLLVWSLFVLMFFLHQDFWWWEESFLVFGFLPIGLAYHAGFSLACSVLGWLAIQYAWPEELEKFEDSDDKSSHP